MTISKTTGGKTTSKPKGKAKTFEERLRAASKAASTYREDLDEDTLEYVAEARGHTLRFPLPLDLKKTALMEQLSGDNPTSEFLDLVGKLAGQETADELAGMPVQLATAILHGWLSAFAVWQEAALGE